ncbi:MAG: major capsid family protein [Candidatus Obscuribacterales bacterium]|jgi:hypothetical protein
MSQHVLSNKDFSVNPRKLQAYYGDLVKNHATMDSISVKNAGFGVATMDAQTAPHSAYNTPVLNQFLQNWLPGAVRAFTAPRRAEELLGFVQAGDFADESIVARFIEMFGFVQTYGDLADVPRAGYNMEFLSRQVVRFQGGIQTDKLESDRMSKIGISDLDEKRASLARSFAITENLVAFNGYTGVRCYGLLNDPNLPAYETVAATGTGSSPLWSTKTTALQMADILTSVKTLYQQTKTAFDPRKEAFTWAVGTNVAMALANIIAVSGTPVAYTLGSWVKEQYPNIRIITIPEFDAANGGADVWYMYKETTVDVDNSTDDGSTITNLLQQRMFMLSALPTKSGGSMENYASAQAGVFVKRPILVTRWSGM